MALKPIEFCSVLRDWPEEDHICVLLRKPGENLFLPLWITPERLSVVMEVLAPESVALNRPSTFSIIHDLNTYLRSPLSEARIDGYDQGVFMASLVLDDGTLIEARALDAILTSRVLNIPLLIDSDVLYANGVSVPAEDVRTYLKMEPAPESVPPDSMSGDRSEEVDRFAALMKDMGVTEEEISPRDD